MEAVLQRGVSETARFIRTRTQAERQRLQESNALGTLSLIGDELATLWEDCRQPNWDGYQALPVTQDGLRNAYVFLEALPLGFPLPSLGAEPDGDLTMEWHHSAQRTLSISVTPEGNLHYAALLGPNRKWGTEAFFGDVPNTIVDLIRQVYAA
jgi:hypothetical protein